MTRFKVGDEVYVKFTVKRVDDSSVPYSLENNGVFVWTLDDENIISADRVEIKEEIFKFGEVVQVPRENANFDEWENAVYIRGQQGNHIVALEKYACLAHRLQCRRKQ